MKQYSDNKYVKITVEIDNTLYERMKERRKDKVFQRYDSMKYIINKAIELYLERY